MREKSLEQGGYKKGLTMNNKGEANLWTIIAVVAVAGFLAYQMGWLNLGTGEGTGANGGASDPTDTTTKNCPTTGITTYTLNVQDELASTATNVDSEYYIFNGNKLIKEGTTGGDGSVDVDITCGKDYKLLLLNTTATAGSGAYSKIVDLKARTSADTINTKLVLVGTGKILGMENPADPSRAANVSLVAGATKQFDLKLVANATAQGYNRPVIMCQANISSIQSLSVGSFSDGSSVASVSSLPKRISATANYQYYAWEYPKMLTPQMGVITASGTITVLASVTPSTTDSINCILVDQATWKTSGYKTANSIDAAFKTGIENTETLSDVGGPDAAAVYYGFAGSY